MKSKRCTKCGDIESINNFYKCKKHQDGYHYMCKDCASKERREYYLKNSEKIKAQRRKYYLDNPECVEKMNKKWQKNNPEKVKEMKRKWALNNREKCRKATREYYKNNSIKIKKYKEKWYKNNLEYYREYQNKKMLIPKSKLSNRISSAIGKSLKGNKDGRHWEKLVGYNLRNLMLRLEKLFEIDMNWKNYGKWHIDHIIPISLWNFNSYNDREFKQCWALCNLQPLWASENWSKGSRV